MTIDPDRASVALRTAEASATPLPPFGEAAGDVDSAYEVQAASVRAWLAAGRTIVGRKIGLTNPRVQQQLNVSQPDFGVLFDDMGFESGAGIPFERVMQPRIEAEMAFMMADDIDDEGSLQHLSDAVGDVRPVLEVVGSRIANWEISIFDTIADNASCGAFVLGVEGRPLREVDLIGAEMLMHRTRGDDRELVSQGRGADCLGSPLAAAQWLAAELIRRGEALRRGDIVLTGALGPMLPVQRGDAFEASIAGLGEIAAHFV